MYETRSNLAEENEDLVLNMVHLVNQHAAERHYQLNVNSAGPTSAAETENLDVVSDEEMSPVQAEVLVQVLTFLVLLTPFQRKVFNSAHF